MTPNSFSQVRPSRFAARILVTALMVFVGAGGLFGDDRDLLRETSRDPYVFILFDTSGSMHWTPQCTNTQFAAGDCNFLCPTGDCFPSAAGDDPASKFFQAKSALHEVISSVEDINLGFATFNQDELRARDKHWLYEVATTDFGGGANGFVTLESGRPFPQPGDEELFGWTWNCDEGTGSREVACGGEDNEVADLDDPWERRRAGRVPKLGRGPVFAGGPGNFLDRFDSVSFSNSDGSLAWSGDWIETDDAGAGPGVGKIQVSGGRISMGNRPMVFTPAPSIARQADLSGFSSAFVSFDWSTTGGLDTSDSIAIEVSTNGGGTYTQIASLTGISGARSGSESYDISGFLSATTRVRLRIENYYGGSNEFMLIDNFSIGPPQTQTIIFIRDPADGKRYKVFYRSVAVDLPNGDPNAYGNPKFVVEIEAQRCTNYAHDCTSTPITNGTATVWYDYVTDFLSWDSGVDRTPPTDGFFNQGGQTSGAGDPIATDTCRGLDPNDGDPRFITMANDDDPWNGYTLRWPTQPFGPRFDTAAPFGTIDSSDALDFSVGDFVPLDWEDDHKQDILERLAPNQAGDPMAAPDFRSAVYLEDARLPGEPFIRLKDEAQRPMVADGATPLGASLDQFRRWYEDTFQPIAEQFDTDFNCRKKFVMVLTDGDETCGGNSLACASASRLKDLGLQTFVVAFGVQGGSNTLSCMAANGGTGDPIFPQNKQELVDALNRVFDDIRSQSRAFAAASVPTVQNETSDKIFLSSFTPIRERSVWPGRIDAFRRPLPLNNDGTPDFTRSCRANNLNAACHLWNAADELLGQALPSTGTPSAEDLRDDMAMADFQFTPSEFALDDSINRTTNSNDTDLRRVIYSQVDDADAIPSNLRLFYQSDNLPIGDRRELWDSLGLNYVVGDAASEQGALQDALEIIITTLSERPQADITDPVTGAMTTFPPYVLGDIFHADPQITGSPNNLSYFVDDLHRYRAFADTHFWRRKMLVVGANDGQLHFFDAGIYRDNIKAFDDGEGRELFSYIPSLVMPVVRHNATQTVHAYSVDGSPSIADVYIDPIHGGTPGTGAQERGWRTVMIGGLREGGDIFRDSNPVSGFIGGYYALDVTQPDLLDFDNLDEDGLPLPARESRVPTCMDFEDGRLRGVPEAQANDKENLGGAGCVDGDYDGNELTNPGTEYRCNCKSPAGSPLPFPAELWTFSDQAPRSLGGPLYLDEEDLDADGVPDGNNQRDLGDTWSQPVIGRIKVCGGSDCDLNESPDFENVPPQNDLEERFVAIFGGGIDPNNPNTPSRGSWLYMVDVETGRTIYKEQLDGAAPASPTVLDIDRDGFFDVIYIGTTEGSIYKVDLRAPADTTVDQVPGFGTVTIDNSRLLGDPLLPTEPGADVERITDPAWKPYRIFDATDQLTGNSRPLYQTITAFLVPELDRYALAVGTGDRHNLWSVDPTPGRFFVFVDDEFQPIDPVRTELDYPGIGINDTALGDTTNLLVTDGGWLMELGRGERVITQAFVLVGVMNFTAFEPTETSDFDGDGIPDACARSGVSRAFVVRADNADPFVDLEAAIAGVQRFHEEFDFTTSPFVDQTATKNPDDGSGGESSESLLDPDQAALQEQIRQSLMRYFPERCRFNKSFSLTINASRSDTELLRYATIPVAICSSDWEER